MSFEEGNKLAHGGTRPGSGRKSNAVREACAIEFAKRIPILCKIADQDDGRPLDRIAALKELSRVGLPTIDLGDDGSGGGLVVKVVYQDKRPPIEPEGDEATQP